MVVNCGDLHILKESSICIGKFGHFMELGDSHIDFLITSDITDFSHSYQNVTMSDMFKEDDEILDIIANTMSKYLNGDVLVPFQYSIFYKEDIESVFEAKNDSKCLIQVKENKPVLAYPRTYMDPSKSYVIIGGLGGFGFEFVRWLIERGATKLVINARKPLESGYHISWLQKWKNQGVTVLVNTFDSTTFYGTKNLLNSATCLAPIGGIFNTALHVKDGAMANQTPESFGAVASKIYSVQNTSRNLEHLKYFVVFSSIASSVGNSYQSNYAFANSAVERICETRRKEGFPAMAVEWGPLADVGMLVKLKTNTQFLDTQRQRLHSCLEVVDQYLQMNEPVLTCCVYGDPESEDGEKRTLVDSVALLFGIKNVDEVENSKIFMELGMDSLLAFEVRQLLNKELGVDVNISDVKNLTFERIKSMCQ